jgi:putative ABC transport system substrate-binding protein
MKRRDFITLLGGAATWPLAARAQQPAMSVIGYLGAGSPGPLSAAFRQGLGETGYVEGRNVAIEYRWAETQFDRLPALAAKAASTTIPIVFSTNADPVQFGLVASLSRPSGNLTGVSQLSGEVGAKRLELLHEVVPAATIIGLLLNPTNPVTESFLRGQEAAARILGLQLHVLHASAERDLDPAFATLVQLRAGALMIGQDAFFANRSEQLAALTLRHAVPAIYQSRDFASAGGLMSYGGSGYGSVPFGRHLQRPDSQG